MARTRAEIAQDNTLAVMEYLYELDSLSGYDTYREHRARLRDLLDEIGYVNQARIDRAARLARSVRT